MVADRRMARACRPAGSIARRAWTSGEGAARARRARRGGGSAARGDRARCGRCAHPPRRRHPAAGPERLRVAERSPERHRIAAPPGPDRALPEAPVQARPVRPAGRVDRVSAPGGDDQARPLRGPGHQGQDRVRRLVRGRLRHGAGPVVPARALPPCHHRSPGRDPRQGLRRDGRPGAARLLHKGGAGRPARPPARAPPRPLPEHHRRHQRVDCRDAQRPEQASGRVSRGRRRSRRLDT